MLSNYLYLFNKNYAFFETLIVENLFNYFQLSDLSQGIFLIIQIN